MTISKKLFLIATIAIGIPFNTFTYDAVGLKNEVATASNFVQTLEQQPTAENRKVAKWLKKGLANKNYSSSFSNETVIEIARIVNSNATPQEKVTNLLTVIATEKAAALKDSKKDLKNERKYSQMRSK